MNTPQLSFMNVDCMNSTHEDGKQLTLELYLQAVQQQHVQSMPPQTGQTQQQTQQKEDVEQKGAEYLPIPIPLAANTSLGGSSIMSASTTPLSELDSDELEEAEIESEIESEQHNLVFLDWDDTLFPTTFLITEKQETTIEQMRDFGKSVYDFLNVLIALYHDSNIYIVTNATKDWLFTSLYQTSQTYQALATQYQPEQRALDYFAAIYNSLRTLNIGVVSAADLYCKRYPNQPLLWKIHAFKEIASSHFTRKSPSSSSCAYTIVSIGDSDEEFTASLEAKCVLNRQVGRNPNSNVLLHRIKLVSDPSVSELTKEIKYLSENARCIKYATQPITLRF
eukprot:CAMPEP_0197022114 /NCGR_PEP_ID=MMETSP1384-20130603/3002_1 /TAXON_ID=29189 /ORGANISM="Ammonia sp." /LENGTH=336 /DNA_ID=CAMNT_0042450085 /DNA_START=69 /DNA_END=1079 /DNA_ORIENTATION=-